MELEEEKYLYVANEKEKNVYTTDSVVPLAGRKLLTNVTYFCYYGSDITMFCDFR